jgi:hypothetical protein
VPLFILCLFGRRIGAKRGKDDVKFVSLVAFNLFRLYFSLHFLSTNTLLHKFPGIFRRNIKISYLIDLIHVKYDYLKEVYNVDNLSNL